LSYCQDTLKITLQMYLKMKKKRVGKIKYDKTIYIDIYITLYTLILSRLEFCQSFVIGSDKSRRKYV
jgi:hypothetical protein